MTPYYHDPAAGITIYHGRCEDVLPTLPRADLMLADPPYGIKLEPLSSNREKMGRDFALAGDDSQEVGQAVLDWAALAGIPVITFASPRQPWRGAWDGWLVWDKGPAVGGGKTTFPWKLTWELIQVRGVQGFNGKRDAAILSHWVSPNFLKDFALHPCQKPVALLTRLMEKVTQPRQLVLDPFMGSGSVVRAAKETGRRVVGIEVDERYCEIAVQRLAQGVLDFGEPTHADH